MESSSDSESEENKVLTEMGTSISASTTTRTYYQCTRAKGISTDQLKSRNGTLRENEKASNNNRFEENSCFNAGLSLGQRPGSVLSISSNHKPSSIGNHAFKATKKFANTRMIGKNINS